MRFPNAAIVERLRNQYPAGTRVELLEMGEWQRRRSAASGADS